MDSATAPYCQECDQKDAQICRLRTPLERLVAAEDRLVELCDAEQPYFASDQWMTDCDEAKKELAQAHAEARAALQEPIC